ncbi:hypothetical protein D3C81_2207120 [compost metagenome]
MGVAQIDLHLRCHVLVIKRRTQLSGGGEEHLAAHTIDLHVRNVFALHVEHVADLAGEEQRRQQHAAEDTLG